MESVILVVHLFLALAIIGLVLLQRSEGGGLGIGGSGGGLGHVASAKSMGNLLTRATAICAAAFFCTSLILGILNGQATKSQGILSSIEAPADEASASKVEEKTVEPTKPIEKRPSVPIAE